jgi:TolB protein
MVARPLACAAALAVGLAVAPIGLGGQPAAPPRHATMPAVSPDGRRIAYLVEQDGKDDLYVADTDGAHVTRLTTTDADESRPSWSPTSADVLVARMAAGWSTLFAVPVAGGPERVVVRVPGRNPQLLGVRAVFATGDWASMQLSTSALDGTDVKPLSDGQGAIWNVAISPDGRRVAFTRTREKELQVSTMNADGSDARIVGPFEGRAQMPAWSPDGTRLAVQVSTVTGGVHQGRIWIVDLATGRRQPLIADETPHLDEVPAWFPDGRRLAFQSDRSGAFEIWTVDLGGGAPRQITQPP